MEKPDETVIGRCPCGKRMGILVKIFEGDDVLNSNRLVTCGFADSPLSELPDPGEDPETLRELQMIFGCLVAKEGHYDQKYLDDVLNRFLSACKRAGIDLMQTQNSIHGLVVPEDTRGKKMKKLAELVERVPALNFGLTYSLGAGNGNAGESLRRLADPEEDHHTLRRLQNAFASLVVVKGHRSQEYCDRARDAFLDACRKVGIDLAAPRKLPG